MPRKKLKQQFRRGNEQKYLKTAVYMARPSFAVQLPLLPIVFLAIAVGVVLTITVYQDAFSELVHQFTLLSLPHFPSLALPKVTFDWFPPITFPTVHIPTITLPDISIDITPLLRYPSLAFSMLGNMFGSIIGFIDNSVLLVTQFCVLAVTMVVSGITQVAAGLLRLTTTVFAFVANYSVALSTILFRTVMAGLVLWKENFSFSMHFFFQQFIQETVVLSTISLTVVGIVWEATMITVIAVYTALVTVFTVIASIALFVAKAIISFITLIGSGIIAILDAIGAFFHRIAVAIHPYTSYVSNTISKTMSELQHSVEAFSKTSKALAEMYQRNTSHLGK